MVCSRLSKRWSRSQCYKIQLRSILKPRTPQDYLKNSLKVELGGVVGIVLVVGPLEIKSI